MHDYELYEFTIIEEEMKKLIIFGNNRFAEIVLSYFQQDSMYEVVAFTLDEEWITEKNFMGFPLVPFGEIEKHYDPSEYEMFIAVGYAKLNQVRAEKYMQAKQKRYKLASYISSKATVLTKQIGEHVFILEDNTVQPFVKIGNNVFLWSGNHIGHHSEIKDNCFISSHVVVAGGCEIGENTFIGVNATLRDHIKIGKKNVIGAGAIILSDTEDESLYPSKETEKSKIPTSRLRKI